METLAKRLSDAMKSAGLNQPGLARTASKPNAPVSQQVVHHLLSARNTSSKHLPAIAEALGVSLDWLARGGEQSATLRRTPAKSSSAANGHSQGSGPPDRLPVLGMAECGPDGWSMWNGDIIDTIPRPSNLVGAPRAYAVYIVGDSMEPRYYSGELAHIHPGKPVTIGAFVLVQIRPEHDGDTPKAVVKRLIKRSTTKLVLEQYNPPKKFEIKTDDIVSIHRVVGSGEF
jgi:phage repressor protein C with HTH and peptisase S24 domain